ncbi:MAG TPA: bifunctional (p)ppGpp synthetase/guanosine-3',5'-bis(diphosphate) 3'-pyrophosphohydrolase [Myxococcota bacterium]|nr:bifunctional (p)ppGpp synthetase/guanosine-3',5'-bis(diphosphate) 3'-pyrophosphohydrolase [Myxococcota bacterium]
MIQVSDIVDGIRKYAPDADLAPVLQGYVLAARAHEGQTRKSGEPYITHPLEVAKILVDMRMDVDTVATALLHDALEDNPLTKEEMTAQVGPVITELVDGVTKIGKLKYRSKEELQAENFRKMILAMSRDLRVILVKLADRLHNMRTLAGHQVEKRQRISRETLDVYAPIANRLGITHIKTELEDLCVQNLDPERWQEIEAFLLETQADRDAYIRKVTARLQEELSRASVAGKVSGRAKARSSIYQKMRVKGLDVHDVPDLLAFRVLVPDIASCYLTLGLVHSLFEPVPERIKDYIARPKPNGYQSLHTTVIGPEGRRIEVQIRTDDMHQIAERGIAAHWKYKEGHLALRPEDVVELSHIRDLIDQANDVETATDFMESVKAAFYADEVFVFTPAGEVKQLPLGATPLDFAFAIHSDVGAHCVGAKVDGRIVPLGYTLRTGEKVEILTRPDQRPRRDWLEIARTSRAISKIRRFLRQEEEDGAVALGRGLLDAELHRFEWTLDKAGSEGRLDAYLKERGHRNVNGLLAELARGHQAVGDVAKAILPEGLWYSRQEEARRNRLGTLINRLRGGRTSRSPVRITGEDNVLVQYARCCNPLPGEPVVGFITRGRGISVHRADCKALEQLEEDRRVQVEWDETHRTRHSNRLNIHCIDRPGILASITKICETAGVNIESAEARTMPDGGLITLQLAVTDLAELTKVIRAIERIPGVVGVERVTG